MHISPGLSKGLSKPFKPPLLSNSSLPTLNSVPQPSKISQFSTNPSNKPLTAPSKSISSFKPPLVKTIIPEVKEDLESSGPDRHYHFVFYTKDVKKKTKSYAEGILEITKGKIKLYDSEGKPVYDTPKGRFFKDVPKPEEEYYLGSYLGNTLFNSDKDSPDSEVDSS